MRQFLTISVRALISAARAQLDEFTIQLPGYGLLRIDEVRHIVYTVIDE